MCGDQQESLHSQTSHQRAVGETQASCLVNLDQLTISPFYSNAAIQELQAYFDPQAVHRRQQLLSHGNRTLKVYVFIRVRQVNIYLLGCLRLSLRYFH